MSGLTYATLSMPSIVPNSLRTNVAQVGHDRQAAAPCQTGIPAALHQVKPPMAAAVLSSDLHRKDPSSYQEDGGGAEPLLMVRIPRQLAHSW